MTEERSQELRTEGARIHCAIFRSVATESVLKHYVSAHNQLAHLNDVHETATVNQIIDLGLDIEACELVLRRRDHLLSRKVWLMTYICETQPEYHLEFQLKSRYPLWSFTIEFIYFGVLTVFQTIKGHWSLWRHAIV